MGFTQDSLFCERAEWGGPSASGSRDWNPQTLSEPSSTRVLCGSCWGTLVPTWRPCHPDTANTSLGLLSPDEMFFSLFLLCPS